MLRPLALQTLLIPSLEGKLLATEALDWNAPLDCAESLVAPGDKLPGRPPAPVLVPPAELRKRGLASAEGRATLLHAIAHIEFNAIDLALDIVWRFAGMPELFYREWLRIAQEEAYHFRLLRARLQTLGHDYGDFPAHNGLWEMAEKTKDDLLARLALVPRTLEARGLDVTPPMRAKLAQAGDLESAAVLDIILRDEIGHVEVGNRWFKQLCQQQGLAPVDAARQLASRYRAPAQHGPFNVVARRAAGFSEEELAALDRGANTA
ncbi:ferritin-like domain-containing protein [Curvibacter sp. APW13]|uniref:ferritin-like domain-containing protein n=1 Tax=Curvibacter sp. APW13 TaxID=3077236 RepID=UPI0028E02794|nr:ferritin-like domain-containing protein [Curvibacter sp. APW13]MDT8990364.1 ferritin-like domain-containing protein [Curvibacter sp. APW13]